jgi:hypothetical protein
MGEIQTIWYDEELHIWRMWVDGAYYNFEKAPDRKTQPYRNMQAEKRRGGREWWVEDNWYTWNQRNRQYSRMFIFTGRD